MHNRGASWSIYGLMFFLQIGYGSIGPLLPELGREFTLSVTQLGLLGSAFGLAKILLDLPSGPLADRVSARAVLVGGTAVSVLGFVISALAVDYSQLLVGRLLGGGSSAVCSIVALLTLTRISDPSMRRQMFTGYQAAMVSGLSLGPAISGVVSSLVGWRASFLLSALVAVVAGGLVLLFIRGTTASAPSRAQDRSAEPDVSPGFPVAIVTLYVAAFVTFFGGGSFRQSVLPLFGSERIGLDAAQLGLILGGGEVVRFSGSLIVGRVPARYGRLWLILGGLGMMGVSAAGFSITNSAVTYALAMAGQAVGGYVYPLTLQLLTEQATPAQLTKVVARDRFFGDIGSGVGPIVLTAVIAWSGFEAAFLAISALYFACAGLIWTVFHGRRAVAVMAEG